jgi:hypothetical protein
MTIRKKDGNIYVLEGPNPIVKTQVVWDPSGLVFHNFSWDEVTFSQVSTTARKKADETPEVFIPTTTSAPIEPVESIKKEIDEVPSENREFDLPYIKYKVLCYCLPAKTKVHNDKLYGESWQRVTYDKKFIFPCVVIQSSDISFEFWTSDPRRQIEEKSIIYPFSYEVHNTATDSYDKVPYDEYRWWKVSGREEKEGGWLLSCVPSEAQPDFSE